MSNRKIHNRFAESLGDRQGLADAVNERMDQPSGSVLLITTHIFVQMDP
ncbi:MAG: hypothetical protein ACYCQJ_03875 [Nitrososphaerales archaeon]